MSSHYQNSMRFVHKVCGCTSTSLKCVQEDLTERNVGKAMAFPLPENDAVRVFGMPRNVLLDVSNFLHHMFLI